MSLANNTTPIMGTQAILRPIKEDDIMADMYLLGAVVLILIYIYVNNRRK